MDQKLIELLVREGALRSKPVIHAFQNIRRSDFVPADSRLQAGEDVPLSIGYDQTISQPSTVAFMLELLDPRSGQSILDVGSGSGWTTALLADIVGHSGEVIAIERIGALREMTEVNVEKYGFVSQGVVKCLEGDGSQGYAPRAPYDRILVSAASPSVPQPLQQQLTIGGKMVIPIGDTIQCLEKTGDDRFRINDYPGFIFVPLIPKIF